MNDFTLSIAGGTATLTNNRPAEVIGYGGQAANEDFGYKKSFVYLNHNKLNNLRIKRAINIIN